MHLRENIRKNKYTVYKITYLNLIYSMANKYGLAKRSYESFLKADTSLCIKVNSLSGNKTFDKVSYIVSKIGDGPAYFLILFALVVMYQKPFLITYRDFLLANMLNLAIYKLLKSKVKRKRPFIVLDSINKLIPPPDEFSFPSGHSAAAAVFCYCSFFHFPDVVAYFTLCWMFVVGFSRVYNGVHYPGDVIMGYFMGAFGAKVALALIY